MNKEAPDHLTYDFLGIDNTLPVIVAAELQEGQTKVHADILKKVYKKVIE